MCSDVCARAQVRSLIITSVSVSHVHYFFGMTCPSQSSGTQLIHEVYFGAIL
jgi:hypothetical protein